MPHACHMDATRATAGEAAIPAAPMHASLHHAGSSCRPVSLPARPPLPASPASSPNALSSLSDRDVSAGISSGLTPLCLAPPPLLHLRTPPSLTPIPFPPSRPLSPPPPTPSHHLRHPSDATTSFPPIDRSRTTRLPLPLPPPLPHPHSPQLKSPSAQRNPRRRKKRRGRERRRERRAETRGRMRERKRRRKRREARRRRGRREEGRRERERRPEGETETQEVSEEKERLQVVGGREKRATLLHSSLSAPPPLSAHPTPLRPSHPSPPIPPQPHIPPAPSARPHALPTPILPPIILAHFPSALPFSPLLLSSPSRVLHPSPPNSPPSRSFPLPTLFPPRPHRILSEARSPNTPADVSNRLPPLCTASAPILTPISSRLISGRPITIGHVSLWLGLSSAVVSATIAGSEDDNSGSTGR
ncbi:unnamed protein product [Closterium sp. NIES-64]|nr:unnamed protein product [Closterium sp. NIES-64]